MKQLITENDLMLAIRDAVFEFTGKAARMNFAVGFLTTGYYFGWRYLVIVHSKRTIRVYETMLDIKIREFFPEFGTESSRSCGLSSAVQHDNFWRCVSGDIKLPDRHDILCSEELKLYSILDSTADMFPDVSYPF